MMPSPLCDKLRPDVMIIDLKMPGGGIKAVTEIHRRQAMSASSS